MVNYFFICLMLFLTNNINSNKCDQHKKPIEEDRKVINFFKSKRINYDERQRDLNQRINSVLETASEYSQQAQKEKNKNKAKRLEEKVIECRRIVKNN